MLSDGPHSDVRHIWSTRIRRYVLSHCFHLYVLDCLRAFLSLELLDCFVFASRTILMLEA